MIERWPLVIPIFEVGAAVCLLVAWIFVCLCIAFYEDFIE